MRYAFDFGARTRNLADGSIFWSNELYKGHLKEGAIHSQPLEWLKDETDNFSTNLSPESLSRLLTRVIE